MNAPASVSFKMPMICSSVNCSASSLRPINGPLASCPVAERHWDQVGWAIAENAWRFTAVSDEVL
jgi:hypothetical protein